MIRGLYSSANGLLVQSVRSDAIAGNLAGLSVAGYRGDVTSVSSFERSLELLSWGAAAGSVAPAALLGPDVTVDLQPGSVRATGERFDLALEGPGFFCVQTPTGEAYTRGGAFRLNATGHLVTASGDLVLGDSGPIRMAGTDVGFGDNGEVVVDGAIVGRLKLVELSGTAQVERLGRGLLKATAPGGPAVRAATGTRVRQGYLEEANVNAVSELAAMISALRAFEASQRALQAADETLGKAINEVGRV